MVSALRCFVPRTRLTRRASVIGALIVLAFGIVAPAYALLVGDPLGIVQVGTTSSDSPNAQIAVANGGSTSSSRGPCLLVVTCPNVTVNTTGPSGYGTLAVSGTGSSIGYISVSGTGSSAGDLVAVSGTKSASSGGSGGLGGIAVSGTGNAYASKVAISGTGHAYAPTAVSGGSIIP
jgi:hypothetical protein